MFSDEQIDEMIELLITLDSNTKIYFGTDSIRYRKEGIWWARYATVAIVHMNGNKGCRIFKIQHDEIDYDARKNRPAMRMMREVALTCDLYNQLLPLVDSYSCEIHADINLDEKFGSNCVASQAAGYILGVTGISEDMVHLKPTALSASFGADRAAHGKLERV